MKKFRYLITGICLIAGIQGCNKIDAIKTIDLSENLKKSFTITISETDSTAVSDTFNIDASTNTDIAKYLNKVEKYTITRIAYTIKDYSGAAGILFNGHFYFGDINYEVSNLDLDSAAQSQAETEIQFSQTALDAIAADLKDGNKLSGKIDGLVSAKPVSVTIEFTFAVVARVNIL